MARSILECDGIPSRRRLLRLALAAGSLAAVGLPTSLLAAAPKLPWATVVQTVRAQLATRHGYLPGDLIARGDVEPVMQALEKQGWKPATPEELLKLLLDDGHFLVRQLRSTPGMKFMRGVAKEPLVFDRLDRLSEMPGGQQLVHDIIRLPDGQQLMKKKPTPGFTDLSILLPKQANGKTPTIKDYSKPTGKIYTENDLVKALEKAYHAKA